MAIQSSLRLTKRRLHYLFVPVAGVGISISSFRLLALSLLTNAKANFAIFPPLVVIIALSALQ